MACVGFEARTAQFSEQGVGAVLPVTVLSPYKDSSSGGVFRNGVT